LSSLLRIRVIYRKHFKLSNEYENNILNFIINNTKTLGELEEKGDITVRMGIMGFDYWKLETYLIDKGNDSQLGWIMATNGQLNRYQFNWGNPVKIYKKSFNKPFLPYSYILMYCNHREYKRNVFYKT